MRPRHVLVSLAALVAPGCADGAVAEPEPTTAATVSLMELDTIDTLTTAAPVGTATGRAAPTTTAAAPAHVAIVGDSLTVSAEVLIDQALAVAGVGTVTIDAVEGRRINHAVDGKTSGVTAAAAIAEVAEPDLWVVALGTNDVPGFGAEAYRADVEALLAKIPTGAPVIWIDAWIEGRIDEARAANAELRDVVSGRPGAVVIDWFQFGDDPGVIIGDGIHLTDTGQQRYADQIAAAVTSAP